MKFRDVVKNALKSAAKGGVRTALCVFSVFTGVFFICAATVVSDVSRNAVKSELEEIGVRGSAVYSERGEGTDFDVKELARLKNTAGAKEIMPFFFDTGSVRLNKNRYPALIIGADEKLSSVWNVKILFGRGLTREDALNDAKVALIDRELSNAVYKRENTVGKHISVTVGGETDSYEIVGITASQKKSLQSVLGASVPEIVYLPSGTGKKADMLAVICDDGFKSESVCKDLSLRLKEATGTEYAYKDLDVYKDSFLKIGSAVSYLAAALGGTALFVGGVGVMSNMAASAESRRREIGIYVSQGASKKDVALLFLTESLAVCALGGIIAWALCAAVSSIYTSDMYTVVKSGLVGIASSVSCGALFGLIPALRASSLDPTETIRE